MLLWLGLWKNVCPPGYISPSHCRSWLLSKQRRVSQCKRNDRALTNIPQFGGETCSYLTANTDAEARVDITAREVKKPGCIFWHKDFPLECILLCFQTSSSSPSHPWTSKKESVWTMHPRRWTWCFYTPCFLHFWCNWERSNHIY